MNMRSSWGHKKVKTNQKKGSMKVILEIATENLFCITSQKKDEL